MGRSALYCGYGCHYSNSMVGGSITEGFMSLSGSQDYKWWITWSHHGVLF